MILGAIHFLNVFATSSPSPGLTRILDKLPSQNGLVLLYLPFKTLQMVLGPKD
jgi:hypothetical protein